MIQKGTLVNVSDNSGGHKGCCIHVYGGYRKRYAKIGDIILLTIKKLRKKKKEKLKVKKGEIIKGLVIKTKVPNLNYSFESISSFENSVVLLNRQTNKFIGSRIFSSLEKKFRFSKYLRMLSICSGVIN